MKVPKKSELYQHIEVLEKQNKKLQEQIDAEKNKEMGIIKTAGI